MDKYTFQTKIQSVLSIVVSTVPKILKSMFNIFSFVIYIITLLWVFITNIVTLGILYIGAFTSYLAGRINNGKENNTY